MQQARDGANNNKAPSRFNNEQTLKDCFISGGLKVSLGNIPMLRPLSQ